jgi:hypothetical protein
MLSEETHVGPESSTPRCTAINSSIRSKSPLGEAQPQFTEVLTAGEELVSLNDGIASVEERGTTLLELHSVQYEPD